MRPQPSSLDLSLNRFAAARAEFARREKERQYLEMSRASLVRHHGPTPADPQAAAMLGDLDARIARLRGW